MSWGHGDCFNVHFCLLLCSFLWLIYFYSLCLPGLQLWVYQFSTSTFKETMKMPHLWQQSKVSWLLREHTHKHFQSPTLSVTDSYFFNNCCLATHLHSVIIFAWNVCGKQRGRGVQRRGKTKGLMKRKSEVIECDDEWVDVKRWAWDKVTCSPNLSLSKTKCSLAGQPHPFLTFRTCSPIIHLTSWPGNRICKPVCDNYCFEMPAHQRVTKCRTRAA